MRRLHIVILMIGILTISACGSSDQVKPIREETIDFDLNEAAEMVKKKERMILDLSSRDKVTNQEYMQLEQAFSEEFGAHARDILTIFMINDMDAAPESDLIVQKNTLYPTVFHEGISITDAVVYKSYYENEFFNQTRLTIREAYVGDDEKLKDWNREYIFVPGDNGEWELNGFSGVMNFLGDEYSMSYLGSKQSEQ